VVKLIHRPPALAALGRLVKTRNILRYLHDEPLRLRIQTQLNRGEARHSLARRLFFADQGEFRTSDPITDIYKV
jgi:TnpA family transposase